MGREWVRWKFYNKKNPPITRKGKGIKQNGQGEQSFYCETSKVSQANHITFICLGHCSYCGGGRDTVGDGCAF